MVYERSTPDARVAAIDAPALGCSIALLEVAGSGVGGSIVSSHFLDRKKAIAHLVSALSFPIGPGLTRGAREKFAHFDH